MKYKFLENPESEITKSFLFIYSMETFIVYNLNKSEREQDLCKILSFGPYSYALNIISR